MKRVQSGNLETESGLDWPLIKSLLPVSLEPGYLPALAVMGKPHFNKFLFSLSPAGVFSMIFN